MLKYKTRGNVSPQGKSRVYYCCNREEFHKYFESISEEILGKQNCAVWYDESSEIHYDEAFFSNLGQMQLFVIPITRSFLCTENNALNIEFKFAEENHIPILPLMQESGLEKLFNQKCGDIQFLDKNVVDLTAISYDEKLKKFLDAVLIGDELGEQIRAAFDAYVFLSYRKKDRKYAQELMKLIHSNEFARDIAIWYDEFLTPGENFNNAISEALEKCDVFTLAVTPNLINEKNYVLTTEYPMAKAANKPILPVEMEDTDKSELYEKYKQMPDCIKASDSEKLSASLLNVLKNVAIRVNDNDPQHNFFIGLAYLGGVDVEVNHERALKLITLSAESGHIAAMKKLSSMYLIGEGVSRDVDVAIEWNKKAVDEYMKLQDDDDPNSIVGYWSAIIELGDLYTNLMMYDEAVSVYINLYDTAEKYNTLYNCDSLIPSSCFMLAKTYSELHRYSESIQYYKKCCEYSERRFYDTKSSESLNLLMMCYIAMGTNESITPNISMRAEFIEKCISYCKKYNCEIDNYSVTKLLGRCLYEKAKINTELNKYTTAKKAIQEAIGFLSQNYSETKSDTDARTLAMAYEEKGTIHDNLKEYSDAKLYYEKAAELFRELMNKNGDIKTENEYTGFLMYAYININLAELTKHIKMEKSEEEYYAIVKSCAYEYLSNTEGNELDLGICPLFISVGVYYSKHEYKEEAIELFMDGENIADRYQTKEAIMLSYYAKLLIHKAAKEINNKTLLKEYEKKMKTAKAVYEKDNRTKLSDVFRSGKFLWGDDIINADSSVFLFESIISDYADTVCQLFGEFSDKKHSENRINGILNWLSKYIYVWRIPFYPILASLWTVVAYYFYEIVGNYEIPRYSGLYIDKIEIHIIYQIIVMTMISWLLMLTHKYSFLNKFLYRTVICIVTIFIALSVFYIYARAVEINVLTVMITGLIFPVAVIILGHIVTRLVNFLLSVLIKRSNR